MDKGSAPRVTRNRLTDPHDPNIGYFVYPSGAPVAHFQTGEREAETGKPPGLEEYTRLRELQRQRKKKGIISRRGVSKGTGKKRLPAHNPFVGYFHHSRLDDPINVFLNACASASASVSPCSESAGTQESGGEGESAT